MTILEAAEYCGMELVQSGKELAGICQHPGHNDTRPSVQVNEEDNVWYCQGCGVGGSVFHFLIWMDTTITKSEAWEMAYGEEGYGGLLRATLDKVLNPKHKDDLGRKFAALMSLYRGKEISTELLDAALLEDPSNKLNAIMEAV